MQNPPPMRKPPEGYASLDPSLMTDDELRRIHYDLGDWIEEALAQAAPHIPTDETYDSVYAKLSEISSERAARQSEDRGGIARGRF